MAKRDPYTVLGVSRSATDDQIKKAYRRLARQHHPDLNNSSKISEARFKEVQGAYDILSDPEKRRKYDMFGHEGVRGDFGGFGSSEGRNPFGSFRYGNSGFTFNFGNFSGARGPGIFDDIFSDLFGQGAVRSSKRHTSARGQDVEYNLSVDFDQAYHGASVVVRVLDKTIDVHIPAGVDNGSRIRVVGQGAPGMRGGPPGDLYLNIRVNPHQYFVRDGKDIHLTIPITFGEAVLGSRVEIPSPAGRLALKISPGTQSGTRFRFTGKGFPDLKGVAWGDFYVTVHIVVPETLDPFSRELVEEFERRNPFTPRHGW
jgi:DnaJ-class molecular chaperone